jgi:hypothetical protein
VDLRDLPGGERPARHGGAAVEDADRAHDPLGAVGEPHAVAHAQRAREQAHVGDRLAGGAALDLEHGALRRPVRVPGRCREQLADAAGQRIHAGAGHRRAEEHGVHERPRGLRGQLAAQPPLRERRPVVDDGREQRVVVVGEHVDEAGRRLRERVERGLPRADARHGAHRHDRRREPLRDGAQHAGLLRARAVDLVDEDERRDPQAPQRAHEHARLRLHALDGGDDEHRAVEHAERPLHLGDEVRVARCVDQVDGDVVDDERDDGGLDRDAAPALERQGVGLRAAAVD